MHPRYLIARGVPVIVAALSMLPLAPVPAGAQAESPASFVPVTDAMLEDPAAGDWLTWRRTPDGWGYSPLDQIDTDNVGELRLVWSRALAAGSQEGTPLAYGGVLYMPNPSDVIQAIDAVTGDLRWEYRRELPDDIDDYVNGSMTNRNIAIYGNHIIDTSADNYLYALDAETGRLVWETRILDYLVNPARHSSGPIVAGGKAVSGRSCRPHGGPEACVITAHDAVTGAEVWRRRLVPAPGEPGDETWGGVPYEERVHVGSWMAPSYDPELNLVYVGTSVTSPAPKFLLGGIENNYLYHNSTLALDGDTGEIVWYYQHLNDHWDLDHPFERLLVDTAVAPDPAAVSWINPRLERGAVRKVLTGIPGKTGVVYTLDRETGEFLWARPTVTQNVISAIDGATGEVTENAELIFTAEGQEVLTCPTWFGGKDWEAGAYSPRTNTMYMPLRNTCARMLATREARIHYALALRHQLAPGTDQLGTVQAISAETGATEWLYEQRAATMSLVATGGGLVFGGDVNGRFRAFDDETGDVLWEINLGSSVTGFPITYAVDGRQYVAVSTGTAGTASGFMRLTPELRPSAGNNLFVFALPERDDSPYSFTGWYEPKMSLETSDFRVAPRLFDRRQVRDGCVHRTGDGRSANVRNKAPAGHFRAHRATGHEGQGVGTWRVTAVSRGNRARSEAAVGASPAYAGGGGSPKASGTTGSRARNISAISGGRSRPRWRAVRTTLDSTCWGAPGKLAEDGR